MSHGGTDVTAPAPAGVIRVALLGYGRVGQAVASGIEDAHDALAAVGVAMSCSRALVRDPGKPRHGPPVPCGTDGAAAIAGSDLVIEAIGGREPAFTLVRSALDAGIPVVTANKTLVAHHGRELRTIAAARGTTFAFDAAVLAGVPFLGALSRRPLISSARRIAGIINGTCHFLTGALERGDAFEAALADAVALGYAEPDSHADVSGRDAAEKLSILLHLAGHEDVTPASLPSLGLDAVHAADFRHAREVGGVIKPVALADLDQRRSGAWVGPAFVACGHPFAQFHGIDNTVAFTDGLGQTVTFSGPGAGPVATARTIIDDAVEVALGGRRRPSTFQRLGTSRRSLQTPPESGWFVSLDRPAVSVGELASRLAGAGVPALRLCRRDGRILARTAPSAWPLIRRTLTVDLAARVLILPVLDQPDTSTSSGDSPASQEPTS